MPSPRGELAALKVVSDNEPEDEDYDFDIPDLTPEIMMRMLANMQANGMI